MINILPYNQKKLIQRVRYLRMITASMWGAIVLLLITIILSLPTLFIINARYTLARAQAARLEESGSITKAVDVVSLQQRTKLIKDKLAFPLLPSPMQYVAHIRTYENNGIQLTGYDITDASKPIVGVHGIASTRQNLQAFLNLLEADPAIASVDSPITNFVKSTQSEFAITVTFKAS